MTVLRNFRSEILVVVVAVITIAVAYRWVGEHPEDSEFAPIAMAGFLFVLAQVYGRLRDRRDGNRKRAQELFFEWYSTEVRESRIYVSRWRSVFVDQGEELPSLSAVERAAATAYKTRYETERERKGSRPADQTDPGHELHNDEARELHFFRIYQFFERWARLVKNGDIDHRSASAYLVLYKQWYLDNFITMWALKETDRYIRHSLEEILYWVEPSGLFGRIGARLSRKNKSATSI